MPGLSQLKKFNSDILSLGNEAELRAQRGERVVSVPIPRTVKDIDDSNDFVMGISDLAIEPSAENKNINTDEDLSDITGSPATGTAEKPAESPINVNVPDLSSLVSQTSGTGNTDSMPDLSMFMEDEPPTEEAPPQEEKEPDIADLSLDDLLGGAVDSDESPNGEEEADERTEDIAPVETLTSDENATDMSRLSSDRLDQAIDMSVLQNPEQDNKEELSEIPSLEDAIADTTEDSNKSGENVQSGEEETAAYDLEDLEPLQEEQTSSVSAEPSASDSQKSGNPDDAKPQSGDILPGQMFSLDDLEDLSENAPEEVPAFDENIANRETLPEDFSEEDEGNDIKLDDIAFDAASAQASEETPENQNTEDDTGIQAGQMFSLDNLDSLSESSENENSPDDNFSAPPADFTEPPSEEPVKSGVDFSDFDLPETNMIWVRRARNSTISSRPSLLMTIISAEKNILQVRLRDFSILPTWNFPKPNLQAQERIRFPSCPKKILIRLKKNPIPPNRILRISLLPTRLPKKTAERISRLHRTMILYLQEYRIAIPIFPR